MFSDHRTPNFEITEKATGNDQGKTCINVDFMQEIVGLSMEKLEDPDFNVTMMLEKIHISHSTLEM